MKNQRTNWLIATLALSTILAPNSYVTSAAATTTNTQQTTAAPAQNLLFSDLQDVSAERQNSIARAVQEGLLHGDAAGSFRPSATLSREEMAVLLTQALQLPLGQTVTSFADVDANGWASRYIEAVRNAGLMVGDGNGSFRPADFVSSEEMAVLLMRAAQLPLAADAAEASKLNDWNGVSAWAKPFVNTALQTGAMHPTDARFQPDAHVQRQEIADMLLATFFPTDRPAFLQRVEDNKVWINGVAYQLADSVKGLLHPDNRAVLQGAKVQFQSANRTLQSISKLELHASGQAAASQAPEFSGNLTLDGHGATLNGDLVLAGNYLSVHNLTVAHDFQITPELANDFSALRLQVQGKTFIQGGDQHTVQFEDSQLQQVEVSKPDVHVVTQGNSSVQQMTVSSNATIVSDPTSTLQQVTLADGAQQVDLQGAVQEVVVTSSQPTTLTGQAEIGKIVVNSAAAVNLNSSGTVGTLQVNNAASAVKISANSKVSNVSLAAGVPSSAVSGAGAPSAGTTNTAPVVVAPISNQFFTVGDPDIQIDLSGHFTDAEQTSLKFGATSSSSAICKVTTAGSIITLTAVKNGTVTISVLADDLAGKKTPTTFKVTVNAPPAAAAIPVQSIQLGTGDLTLSLNTLFTDADNDPITYTVQVADPTIATYTLSGDQLALTPAQVGNTAVTVKATDGRGGELSKTFQLNVTPPPNQNPVVQQTPTDQTLTVGNSDYTLDLAPLFADADNDALTYEAVSSDPTVAAVTVTGSQAVVHALASGTTTIQLKAKDGHGGEVTSSFIVTVNTPPASSGIADQTKALNTGAVVLALNTLFTDADNDSLTYNVTVAAPAVASYTLSGDQLTLTPAQVGSTSVTVKATDGRGGELTKTFQLTVTPPPNQVPAVQQAPTDQTLTVGTADYTLDLSTMFADADNDALTYEADSSDPTKATVTVTGSHAVVHALASGATTIQLKAKDGHGGVGTSSFAVTVNEAPAISALPAQTLQAGSAPTVLDLSSYLSDPENDALTVSASSADTGIATVSVSNQQLTLTPLASGHTTVTVTVNDGRGGSKTATIALTVAAAPGSNQAPAVVASIYEQVLTSGVTNARTFDLAQLFEDADGDAMTFTAVADTPQIVDLAINGNSLTLSAGTTAGSANVTITADDGQGGTATYVLKVRNAPTVANGYVEIRTKQGVQSVTYDLSTMFPNQTSFQVYEGTPDSTFTGPTTLNGTIWTANLAMPYVWVIGADGRSVVFHVTVDPQGASNMFFSEFLDAGDGRMAIELYWPGDGDPSHKAEGYELEVHQYMKKTNTMRVWSQPLLPAYPTMPYIFINSTFYDAFDIMNIWYYNEELAIFDPTNYNTVAYVLKKNGQIVDVLGDPTSHNQFLPNGGTITRKKGILSGSQSFGLYGEWDIFPKGTFQFFGTHTP